MRRVLQIVASLLLALAFMTPLVECIDHWDHDTGPGHDTELSVAACLGAAGVVLGVVVLTGAVRPKRLAQDAATSHRPHAHSNCAIGLQPPSTPSPPLVALRI